MRWLVFLGLALFSGCSILRPVPPSGVRPAQPESAPFAINGRISIDHHGERHSAGLHWTHKMQSDEILLLNPLGQTAARIYRDDGIATLDEGGKHYQDADAESLMQQVLGWHLPLAGLHQWVLGVPAADTPAQIERGSDERIIMLRQDGWEVHYLGYADASPGDEARCAQQAGCAGNAMEADSLPKRLQLKHEDLQILLLIDEWQWDPQ